jgi:adenine-specific DNA-methyltransferase
MMAERHKNNGRRLEDLEKEELIELVKTFKKQKKFGLVWEDKPEDVVLQCKKQLPVLVEVEKKAIEKVPGDPTNLIIEGDNYHALSVLNYTHQGKIDVIYIDPPYNTGAQDWKYNNDYVDENDTFRHSKWLSMMEKRLLAAKNLLREDGVLVCAIDDNEQANLGVLLEELFPSFERHCVTIVHNPRGIQGSNFSYTHEYAFFVFRSGLKVIGPRKIKDQDVDWRNLRDNGGESLRSDARNCFYPIIVQNGKVVGFGEVVDSKIHPEGQTIRMREKYYVYPIDQQGIERKWRYARQSVDSVAHLLRVKERSGGYEIEIGKNYGSVRTVWQDSRYDSNEHGTKILSSMFSGSNFSFPKSIWNVYDCIAPTLHIRHNGVVLDFFAGSGTTGHAVMKLNEEDGCKRQFILCTNNENKIAEEVTYPRIKKVIQGYGEGKNKVKGIPANVRYFKTDFVDRDETSDDTKRKLVERSVEMICVRENTFTRKVDNRAYKIYTDGKKSTGILFEFKRIGEFKDKVAKLKLPAHLYVFSLTDDAYEADFADLPVKHKLVPIPESILEVYRKLFRNI